jgi:hypothetical protein
MDARFQLAGDGRRLLMWREQVKKSDKSTTRDAADLQAQLSEAFSQQFGRSGETYSRLFAAMREEITGFVQRRVDANMATFRAWGECRSLNDAFAVQQKWLQSAFEQYVDQSNRVIETCRQAAADLTESAETAGEDEKPTERKASARHAALDIKDAA